MKKIYTIIFIILISLIITGCNKETEVIVEDVTIEYDGNYHKIVPQNLTDDMEYYYIIYGENEFRDVGEYEFIIEVYDKGEFHGMYEAILTIIPKQIYTKTMHYLFSVFILLVITLFLQFIKSQGSKPWLFNHSTSFSLHA